MTAQTRPGSARAASPRRALHLRARTALRAARHPCARPPQGDGGTQRGADHLQRALLRGFACALGDVGGALHVDARQEQQELFTAPADDSVTGAQHARQQARHGDEDLVTGGVAVLVIDELEVVDVRHDDRERVAAGKHRLERMPACGVASATAVRSTTTRSICSSVSRRASSPVSDVSTCISSTTARCYRTRAYSAEQAHIIRSRGRHAAAASSRRTRRARARRAQHGPRWRS